MSGATLGFGLPAIAAAIAVVVWVVKFAWMLALPKKWRSKL